MISNLSSISNSLSDYATKRTLLVGCGALVGLYTARSLYLASQLPPGPWGLPLVGQLPWLDSDHMDESQEKMHQKYGDIYSFRAGQRLMISVCSYELMRDMFKEEVFAGRLPIPHAAEAAKGCGIVLTEGKVWSEQRRVCLRVLRDFGFGKSQSIEQINEEVSTILRSIEDKSNEVDPFMMFSSLSNSVVSSLLFARRYANEDPRFDQFIKDNATLFDDGPSSSLPLLFPFLASILMKLTKSQVTTRAINSVHKFMEEEIANRESELKDPDAEPLCLADAYIQERRRAEAKGDYDTYKPFHLVRVGAEMFVAGTDTTARSLEWLMTLMSVYPEIQSKVQNEIHQVVGQQRPPQVADRQQLHYTQAVIEESLRFASLAFAGVPHRAVKETTFKGFRIPTDAVIIPFVFGAHRDASVWQRPYEFYPEHFLDSDAKFIGSKFAVAFGTGKRVCPGEALARLEIFHAFTAVMQRYRVKLSQSCAGKQRQEILRGKTAIARCVVGVKVDFERL